MIQNYLFERSADQDVLFLFFSGHGTAIGRDDFGFCMKDAIVQPEDNVVLPTSVVKLSEIIGTLRIKDVSLVLIVTLANGVTLAMVVSLVMIVTLAKRSSLTTSLKMLTAF